MRSKQCKSTSFLSYKQLNIIQEGWVGSRVGKYSHFFSRPPSLLLLLADLEPVDSQGPEPECLELNESSSISLIVESLVILE